jgi:hypothetical protein
MWRRGLGDPQKVTRNLGGARRRLKRCSELVAAPETLIAPSLGSQAGLATALDWT